MIGLTLVAHHRLVHLLWLHIIELVKISLNLLQMLILYCLFSTIIQHLFFQMFIIPLFAIVGFIICFFLLLICLYCLIIIVALCDDLLLRMLLLLMKSYDIGLVSSVLFIFVELSLSGLGLIAHHRLVHFLWLHVVELV